MHLLLGRVRRIRTRLIKGGSDGEARVLNKMQELALTTSPSAQICHLPPRANISKPLTLLIGYYSVVVAGSGPRTQGTDTQALSSQSASTRWGWGVG